MPEDKQSFRDQLIKQETIDPLIKEKCEKEIKEMIEGKIAPVRRISLYISTGFCAIVAVQFIYMLLTIHLPLLGKIGLGIGILFCASLVLWAVRILKSGVYNQKKDSSRYTAMIWTYLVFTVTIFMMEAPNMPGTKGIELLLNGAIFLIGGVAFLISGKLEQQELRTKEKLLEIQIQMAEIMEKLK